MGKCSICRALVKAGFLACLREGTSRLGGKQPHFSNALLHECLCLPLESHFGPQRGVAQSPGIVSRRCTSPCALSWR